MVPFLTVLSGLAWTIVYAESIRIGFRDKTYAMPIAALALNVAWESTYAVHDLMTLGIIQAFVNLIWKSENATLRDYLGPRGPKTIGAFNRF
jgi:hypothetical protein